MSKPSIHCSVCGKRTDHQIVSERQSLQGSSLWKGNDCLTRAQVVTCTRCNHQTFRTVRTPAQTEALA